MKNRIIICAAAALLLAPAVSHARWGLEGGAILGSVDDEDLVRNLRYTRIAAPAAGYNMAGDEVTKNGADGSASLFVEGNAPFRLGFAVGYGRLPEISSRIHLRSGSAFYDMEFDSEFQMLQADLYMKYASKGGRFSVYGGGGVSHTEISSGYGTRSNSGGVGATFRQTKLVPQAKAGMEVFLTKWLSLNVGVRMLFGAVFDDLKGDVMEYGTNKPDQRLIMKRTADGEYIDYTSNALSANERPFKYDLGGVHGSAGLRIYFK